MRFIVGIICYVRICGIKKSESAQKLEANFASQRVAHGQTSRNSEKAKLVINII